MNIRWSPAAYAALQSQVERLNGLYPGAGDRLAESIRDRIAQLTDFAMSGRVVPEYGTVGLREIIVRRYRVFYRIEPGGVEVVTLFHGSMEINDE